MQFSVGKDNRQVSINNVLIDVKQTASRIEEIFKEYDEKIYKLYGKVLDSKRSTDDEQNNRIPFESQKIFVSLMKIGIPLENAYQIVNNVINDIVTHESNGLYNNKIFSTHEIRKIVAYAILHCDLNGISLKTIEEWGDKYVRRYGHDSQRTKIYYKNSSKEDILSFGFVKDTLLQDIAAELEIKKFTFDGEIRKSQLKSMSEDIIDFINNCNLYRIRYDILKDYICEMALQPPHPWLVTVDTAEKIRKYDIDAVNKHYLKIKQKLDNNDYSGEYYIICEMLHHASSSILAGYREILGCRDLDAFTNLKRIVNRMYNGEQDLVLEYSIAELPSDLKYIGVNFYDFNYLLIRIQSNIENRSRIFKITKTFLEDILELRNIAVKLYENANKQEMNAFLHSSWSNYSGDEKKKYIRLFFAVIDHKRIGKFFEQFDNCFWFSADSKGRYKYLIACLEEMDFEKLNNFAKQLKVQKFLERIIIVAEDENHRNRFKCGINKIDSESIVVDFLYKAELERIFYSSNKMNELDAILQEKMMSF